MLSLKDIRQWISDLGIAADERVYIKLDNKQPVSYTHLTLPTIA